MEAIGIVLGDGKTLIRSFDDDETQSAGIIIETVEETHKIGDFAQPGEPEYIAPGECQGPRDNELWITIKSVEAGIVLLDALTAALRSLCSFPELPQPCEGERKMT